MIFIDVKCDRLGEKGHIADPSCTCLETHNLTCEFGTDLKLGPNNIRSIALLFGVI